MNSILTYTTKLSSKGQVVIPAVIRQKLNLKDQEIFKVTITKEGIIQLIPTSPQKKLLDVRTLMKEKILKNKLGPVTDKIINDAKRNMFSPKNI